MTESPNDMSSFDTLQEAPEQNADEGHEFREFAESTMGTPSSSGQTHALDGKSGCHGGDTLKQAATANGGQELLDRFAADYPVGPHDKPQSMCPAFGSLRVGLRMRRTASILCGSACCVYGLTFTSHFYGARRTVGYVPFDSESLVTGKLFEDIRDAAFQLADPKVHDAIVITNLCVPTASGVPLDLLPKEINGVRIVGIDVPGFGVPTHAEAKDVLAAAMIAYARQEVMSGPVPAPENRTTDGPTVTLVGEMFPADPVVIGRMLEPLGLAAGPNVPTREWRELYTALEGRAVAAMHPFYTATFREFESAGRPIVGSGPIGHEGTASWLEAIGKACGIKSDLIGQAQNQFLPALQAAVGEKPIKQRMTISGYEGSELLVGRLLVECGADLRYVGTACPKTPQSRDDAEWLAQKGVQVRFRASLEQDLAAFVEYRPDLVVGTTPIVQKAKETGTPALYFTNLISARPLVGAAAPANLAQTINGAVGSKTKFDEMKAFFGDVGSGYAAGVWEEVPQDNPKFRERQKRRLKTAKPTSSMGVNG